MPEKTRVLILGAGFAGLELSTLLSESLADEVEVTLVDQSDSFVFGFEKLEVMVGRKSADEVRLPYRAVVKPAVEFRRESVTAIDPQARRVTTDVGVHEPDILVVALGADYDLDATPGFVRGGLEFYTVEGAARVHEALGRFDGGRLMVAVLGVPFKCPPAPFEAAFLLHDYLTDRGTRVDMTVSSPMPAPIPPSPDASAAIIGGMRERGIEYMPGTRVASIDPERRLATFADGRSVPYDMFLGIPIHTTPAVVRASGLTEGGADGWVAVDKTNLRTRFPGVYAVGDIADAPVPRAGVFAETAARVVAKDIVARIRGTEPPAPYDGTGTCYIEFGRGLVARVDANFLGGPAPVVPLVAASREIAAEKEAFASSRRARWFTSRQ